MLPQDDESYFIIEHPSRGVLREFIPSRPFVEVHFSIEGKRGDASCRRFASFGEARSVLQQLPERLRAQCFILSSRTWTDPNRRGREERHHLNT